MKEVAAEMLYNHKSYEAKWQKIWEEKEIFKFDENNADKKKYYVLEMFPYPSGKIHMGHLRNYAIGDAIARFKKLQGFNILHPMGFDSFGLPAENAALEHKIHPEKWTLSNVENMREELKSIGLSIDWDREVVTCLPSYYKHEQKIFLDFLKAGLAYQKESFVNWDPIDQTVLANEQVIDGRGWRSGALVEKKKLKQWFLKVSEFSEELLAELKNLKGWDERVLTMQERWIGKSEGLLIDFKITQSTTSHPSTPLGDRSLSVVESHPLTPLRDRLLTTDLKIYTTRPETLFGASFIGISPNHPIAQELAKTNPEISDFIEECNRIAVDEQTLEKQEKRGIKTGLQVTHPLDENWKLDVFIANFVLMEYGTGAIFACPAHDQRDFEFAKKYNLPVRRVVGIDGDLPHCEDGILINSDFLNGLTCLEGKEKIAEILISKNLAEKQINFRLRDWGVSRQRYWGCPIPILYLEDGSVVPVPEEQLPIELPKDVEFTGAGNPLALHPTWKYTTYKTSDGKVVKAIRETDTFDTFFESSWYFLRYISPKSANQAFDKDLANKIIPVDQYVGGVEHAVLHLLYARFFTKALKKCGYLNIGEPFKNLLTQGMVCHQTFKDKNGKWVFAFDAKKEESGKFFNIKTGEELTVGRSEKMSKSKKNVVEPVGIVEKYGADTARLFMLSDTPPSRDLEWSDTGIEGCAKYVQRLWKLVTNAELRIVNDIGTAEKPSFPVILSSDQFAREHVPLSTLTCSQTDLPKNSSKNPGFSEVPTLNNSHPILKLTHKTIKEVGEEYEKMGFNRAIAKIREFSNALEKFEAKSDEDKKIMGFALKNLVILFSPIMPHLAEELWLRLGNEALVTEVEFPRFDPNLTTEDTAKIAIQVLGKLRAVIELPKGLDQKEIENAALQNENVQKFIEGKDVKKIIIIPDKLVNIVIA